MNKVELLTRLQEIRVQAENARAHAVLLAAEMSVLTSKELETSDLEARWHTALNEERKRLSEMNWVLDLLDRLGPEA